VLVPTLQELHENSPDYGSYLFGSTLREDSVPSDIDVIVVYRKGVDISALKTKLNALSIYYPLDITYMTESEERELNFLEQQSAVVLSEVGRTKACS